MEAKQHGKFSEVIRSYENIRMRNEFTENALADIRTKLKEITSSSKYPDQLSIVATGSYGRGEASEESDLDAFMFFYIDLEPNDAIGSELDEIRDFLSKTVSNDTGTTDTFGLDKPVRFAGMTRNIGGENDSNAALTRRLLFLLEGTWLVGEELFKQNKRKLLERYVDKTESSRHIPRFLLNDVIRYYRTIATDFEYKIKEKGKEWGLRSIKLRFSRKLLYFGGIVAVAQAAEADDVIEKLSDSLGRPIFERMLEVSGADCAISKEIMNLYDQFLSAVSCQKTREMLKQVKKTEREQCGVYCDLRDKGNEFSKQLEDWIKAHFDEDHEIHNSLIF